MRTLHSITASSSPASGFLDLLRNYPDPYFTRWQGQIAQEMFAQARRMIEETPPPDLQNNYFIVHPDTVEAIERDAERIIRELVREVDSLRYAGVGRGRREGRVALTITREEAYLLDTSRIWTRYGIVTERAARSFQGFPIVVT